MTTIEIIIFIMRLIIVGMLIAFLYLQWRVRHLNGLVGVLRRSVFWETVALTMLFFETAVFRYAYVSCCLKVPAWVEVVTLGINLFVFISFARGTLLFLDIRSGKIGDDGHKAQ